MLLSLFIMNLLKLILDPTNRSLYLSPFGTIIGSLSVIALPKEILSYAYPMFCVKTICKINRYEINIFYHSDLALNLNYSFRLLAEF